MAEAHTQKMGVSLEKWFGMKRRVGMVDVDTCRRIHHPRPFLR
jgi:hypothetical protein